MLDRIGIILSFGCMIHCILTPIILPLLPMLGFFMGHESDFHLILSGAITLVAGLALIPGYLKHKSYTPLAAGLSGVIIIIVCGIIEHIDPTQPHILLITMHGSGLVILGHYLNHKLSCKCKHHEEK